MSRHRIEIQVVRDLDASILRPMNDEEASTLDGMALNHAYVDMRGCDASDLAQAIEEELEFYADAAEVGDDPETIMKLLDRHFEESEFSFDTGVYAAVVAVSVAGGAPISSCNGGWFGDDHSSSVPHILFSIAPLHIDVVRKAAEFADCGLTNNGCHAELYADELSKLLRFAHEVQKLTGNQA